MKPFTHGLRPETRFVPPGITLASGQMGRPDPQGSFEIVEDVIFQPVEDELVLLSLKEQQYYGLDSIGSRMWHLLLEHGDVETVADRICDEFDADRGQVVRDVESMVEDLCAAGLMKQRGLMKKRDQCVRTSA